MTLTCALEWLLEGHAIFPFTQNTRSLSALCSLLQTRKRVSLVISLVFQNVFQNYHILVAGTARVIFYLNLVEPCEYK